MNEKIANYGLNNKVGIGVGYGNKEIYGRWITWR